MTGPGVYTPAALADLMERRLQEIASQVTAGGRLIGVTGQLVEIPEPRRNGVIYDVKLADPVSTEFVLLEMRPSTLLEVDAQEGDTITAYGPVVANLYKGRATLRLQVDRIELAEPPEERERRAAQLPLLETVRQVGATRNAFPSSPTPGCDFSRRRSVRLDPLALDAVTLAATFTASHRSLGRPAP